MWKEEKKINLSKHHAWYTTWSQSCFKVKEIKIIMHNQNQPGVTSKKVTGGTQKLFDPQPNRASPRSYSNFHSNVSP